MSDSTVELTYPGVENSIHVPRHRVKNYQSRGWKRAADKTSTPSRGSEKGAAKKAATTTTSPTGEENKKG